MATQYKAFSDGFWAEGMFSEGFWETIAGANQNDGGGAPGLDEDKNFINKKLLMLVIAIDENS